jgi:hypothetical protein
MHIPATPTKDWPSSSAGRGGSAERSEQVGVGVAGRYSLSAATARSRAGRLRARRGVHRTHHARTGTTDCGQRRLGAGGLGRSEAPSVGDREGHCRWMSSTSRPPAA